jgi:hypothetical protein
LQNAVIEKARDLGYALIRIAIRRANSISDKIPDTSSQWLDRLAESNSLTAACYVIAAVTAVICLLTGAADEDVGFARMVASIILAVPAGMLLIFSLFGLSAYFLFIPSISQDGHIFARVHRAQLVHPLTTALLLGLLALVVYTGSIPGLIAWACLLAIYSIQTALLLGRLRGEIFGNGLVGTFSTLPFQLLNLILGGELITLAGGGRSNKS